MLPLFFSLQKDVPLFQTQKLVSTALKHQPNISSERDLEQNDVFVFQFLKPISISIPLSILNLSTPFHSHSFLIRDILFLSFHCHPSAKLDHFFERENASVWALVCFFLFILWLVFSLFFGWFILNTLLEVEYRNQIPNPKSISLTRRKIKETILVVNPNGCIQVRIIFLINNHISFTDWCS